MPDIGAAASASGGTSGDTFVRASASQAGRAFIERALQQQGDDYVYGHEVSLDSLDPDTFDCSELVQWAAAQAGVAITDGSWLQYRHIRQGGGTMTVEEALNTPGALLFRFGSDPDVGGRPTGAHVAISLGDGRTIEARGSQYGVGVFDATNRAWTHAGEIPELAGATLGSPFVVEEVDPYGDTDGDGILDRYETLVGTDPFNADTDGDGFIDSVEVVDYGTNPLDAADNARDSLRQEVGLQALGRVVDDPVPLGATEPAGHESFDVGSRSDPDHEEVVEADRSEDNEDLVGGDDETVVEEADDQAESDNEESDGDGVATTDNGENEIDIDSADEDFLPALQPDELADTGALTADDPKMIDIYPGIEEPSLEHPDELS